MSHVPEPWEAKQTNWRGEPEEFNWYISGNAYETSPEDDEDPEDFTPHVVATSVAIVLGNPTAGMIPRDTAVRIVATVNACRGLTPEQVAAIPQVLSLASDLAAMVEIMEEYQPGTDIYTVGEVLKLALSPRREATS